MKNRKVKILIGVSGSGKSTYAKDFVEKNPSYCIVSRDDFRYALQNKGVVDMKLEDTITKLVKHNTKQLLADGFDIVYDATNLKEKYIESFIENVKYLADIDFYILSTQLETCIERDANRERKVGKDVINKQWQDYLVLLDSFDFSVRKKQKKIINYERDVNKKNCFVYDLDGTLAHTNGKRFIFDFDEVEKDDVDYATLQILRCLQRDPAHPYTLIVSGREDVCLEQTKRWLQSNNIRYDGIYMRKKGDSRKDSTIKKEIYEEYILPYFNVIGVFDDRQQVVDAIRDMGIKVFQVEEGLF